MSATRRPCRSCGVDLTQKYKLTLTCKTCKLACCVAQVWPIDWTINIQWVLACKLLQAETREGVGEASRLVGLGQNTSVHYLSKTSVFRSQLPHTSGIMEQEQTITFTAISHCTMCTTADELYFMHRSCCTSNHVVIASLPHKRCVRVCAQTGLNFRNKPLWLCFTL